MCDNCIAQILLNGFTTHYTSIMFKNLEEAQEAMKDSGPYPEEIAKIWHSAYELGYGKGELEEKNRRWRLNDKLSEYLGIPKEEKWDGGVVDKAIMKIEAMKKEAHKRGREEAFASVPSMNSAPMGVSVWRDHGVKYKYLDYFEKKAEKECCLKTVGGCSCNPARFCV